MCNWWQVCQDACYGGGGVGLVSLGALIGEACGIFVAEGEGFVATLANVHAYSIRN